jgi:hypothetical protein
MSRTSRSVQIGVKHARRAVAHAAVAHQLDAFEPEQVIAEPAAKAQTREPLLQPLLALGRAETPGRHQHVGTDGELPLPPRAVKGTDFQRIEPRLGDARQPDRVVGAAGGRDRRHSLLLGRLRDVIGNQVFGPVAEEPCRLASFIALEGAAVEHVGGWVGCLAIDPRRSQRRRVADELVPDTVDDNRVLWRDGVEVVTGGMAAFGEQTLVPTAPDDPLARRRLAHAHRHAGDDLRYGPGVVELDLVQHAAGRLQVVVGVDQPRDDRRSAQVLDTRRRPGQDPNLVAADRDEPPIMDGNGRCPGMVIIDSVHGAVDENQIWGERIGRAGHHYLPRPARRRSTSPALVDEPGGTRGLCPALARSR